MVVVHIVNGAPVERELIEALEIFTHVHRPEGRPSEMYLKDCPFCKDVDDRTDKPQGAIVYGLERNNFICAKCGKKCGWKELLEAIGAEWDAGSGTQHTAIVQAPPTPEPLPPPKSSSLTELANKLRAEAATSHTAFRRAFHSEKLPAELRLLSATDIAAAASVSLRTVREWIATGDLPVVRMGRNTRVRLSDWRRFLEAKAS